MGLEAAIEALGGGRAAAKSAGGAVARAEGALRDLADPNIGAGDSQEQRAERDREMARQFRIARPQGGTIELSGPTASPQAAPWRFQAFGEGGSSHAPLDAALGVLREASGTPTGQKGPKWVPDQAEERPASAAAQQDKPAPTMLDELKAGPVGALDAAGTIVTGVVGQLAGRVAALWKGVTGGKYGTPEGAREASEYGASVAKALTWEPKTQGGREVLEAAGRLAATEIDLPLLGRDAPLRHLAAVGPITGATVASAVQQAPQGALKHGLQMHFGTGEAKAVPGAVAAATGARMGSVGGAQGATLAAQAEATAAKASPVLQAEAAKVPAAAWTPAKLQTLERYVDAETLPVPVRIMSGQASGDPTLKSLQFNRKGAMPQTANLLKEQNENLIANTNAIRETVAPDVYVRTKPEVGRLVIEGIKREDAARRAAITANYKALEAANGGAFPLDVKALVKNADAALHKQLLYDHVPAPIRSTLDRLEKTGMTFENFEALRTRLAAIERGAQNGNERAAAGVIRDAMEALPMPAGAEHLKPLADAARASARERFKLIEADPALRAVVNGKASEDKFIQQFVVGADTKKVETLIRNLEKQPEAQQAVRAGIVDALKDAARIVDDNGVFNQAGYNKMLASLKPKLGAAMPGEQVAQLDQLGRVARVVKGQDAGTFFNNSNTWIASLAEMARSGAERVIDSKLMGLYGIGKDIAKGMKAEKDFQQSLQTGAALHLKEVGK